MWLVLSSWYRWCRRAPPPCQPHMNHATTFLVEPSQISSLLIHSIVLPLNHIQNHAQWWSNEPYQDSIMVTCPNWFGDDTIYDLQEMQPGKNHLLDVVHGSCLCSSMRKNSGHRVQRFPKGTYIGIFSSDSCSWEYFRFVRIRQIFSTGWVQVKISKKFIFKPLYWP